MSWRASLAVSLVVALSGCGGPAPAEPLAEPASTAGDEVPSDDARPAPTHAARESGLPALPAEALSEPVRALRAALESAATTPSPEAPAEVSAWMDERARRLRDAVRASEAVPDEPASDRALAAALLGHALEELIASIAVAPMTEEPERPPIVGALAAQAATYYAYCERRFAAHDDGSAWAPWRAHCARRAQELSEPATGR